MRVSGAAFRSQSLTLPSLLARERSFRHRTFSTTQRDADPSRLRMSTVTTNLAFGITSTTTYEPPFALARRFTTLDHLTNVSSRVF